MNVDDEGAPGYLKIFTELEKADIEALEASHQADPAKRLAQIELARRVTELVHGKQLMQQAEKVTEILTGKAPLRDATAETLQALRQEIPAVQLSSDGTLLEALVQSGLASSNTDARRLLNDGAVYVGGALIKDVVFPDEAVAGRQILIRRGKAFKDTALVEFR